MVNYSSSSLDATFSALADPTRRAILERLARGESTVTELAEPFDMSLPAVSKHLKVLRNAGLLAREKDGRVHRCCLAGGPMRNAALWIARYRSFWGRQLDALAEHLNPLERKEARSWPRSMPDPRRRSSSGGHSLRRGGKSSGHGRTRRS
ncbi:MAG: metalloregulator ArsR/SmtB family transcription factor [Candidatus Rokubacteria bacterium]|nr:metalloregulator ArsR/SmtB family transcription factor [Candidatus Rokubacteria bacterium]